MTLDAAMRLRARADLYTVALDGELVLFDERAGALHHLNPIATIIWQCCDGDATLEEIAVALAEDCGEPPARVRGDVLALAQRLVDAELVATGD
jgi:PqqD family protein of HPr-rel-A system